MKAGLQSLHDKRRQSRVGKEAHAQELDDVRVAEGAHQLTFPHELGRRFLDGCGRDLGQVLEEFVYLFSGADGSRYGHLLHAAVGSGTDSSASEPHVGEQERPQLRVAKKISRHVVRHVL